MLRELDHSRDQKKYGHFGKTVIYTLFTHTQQMVRVYFLDIRVIIMNTESTTVPDPEFETLKSRRQIKIS